MASKTAATVRSDGGLHADQAVASKNKGRPTGGDVVKPCCEHRYELVGYDALPTFLKHDEFMLDHSAPSPSTTRRVEFMLRLEFRRVVYATRVHARNV